MPSAMRREVGRTAENLVTLRAPIFGVLNSATLVLSERKWIRVHFLAELADKLRLRQWAFGFWKVELVLANGKLLMLENCGFATMICVFFVERFASGRAAVFSLVRFVSALTKRRARFEFLGRRIFLFFFHFKRLESAAGDVAVRRRGEQRT